MTGILALAADRADLGGPFLQAAPSDFSERFKASWDESLAPDRWFNIEGARRDKYQAVADALHTATGKSYENPLAYVPGAGSAGPDGNVIDPVAIRQQRIQALIQGHAEATRDVGAELPDPNLIEQQISEEGRNTRQKAASLVDTGGGLGAFFGAATAPTPENLAGFLIPPSKLLFGATPVARGFLASVGREAAFQGAANATLTGASGLADVATGAKELGELPGEIAGAAVAGGAFGALFHTPVAIMDRWNRLPQEVRDKASLEVKDSINVIEREALFKNPNESGIDPVVHDDIQNATVDAVGRRMPPTQGAPLPVVDLTERIAQRERQKAGTMGLDESGPEPHPPELARFSPDELRAMTPADVAKLSDKELDALHGHVESAGLGNAQETEGLYDNIQNELDARGRGAMQDRTANDAEPDLSGMLKSVPADVREQLLAEHELTTMDAAAVQGCLSKQGEP